MMSLVFIVDLAGLIFAIGILLYVYRISKLVKGGVLHKALMVLVASSLIAAPAQAVSLLYSYGFTLGEIELLHEVLDIIVLFLVLGGLMLLCETWRQFDSAA